MYSIEDYDYTLPQHLIAQQPVANRDRSRLLVMDRRSGALAHHMYYELDEFLFPSDVLVINNTEVIPARLIGKKASGGRVELLILNYTAEGGHNAKEKQFVCDCILKSSKRTKIGAMFYFKERLTATVMEVKDTVYTMAFSFEGDFETLLYKIGRTPLPPYIKREDSRDIAADRLTYQTIYASQKGAVAAPTAGLHFTKELMERLKNKGITIAEVTLHVGYGTFLPVRVTDIRQHRMHAERFSISETSAEIITRAKKEGRRVIAVGTTCVRTLEHAMNATGEVVPGAGYCDLFIYPGFVFQAVDAMITNFHLPKSTLLMLVAAFGGRENILNAYQSAIDEKYRFYSYGDAMMIE